MSQRGTIHAVNNIFVHWNQSDLLVQWDNITSWTPERRILSQSRAKACSKAAALNPSIWYLMHGRLLEGALEGHDIFLPRNKAGRRSLQRLESSVSRTAFPPYIASSPVWTASVQDEVNASHHLAQDQNRSKTHALEHEIAALVLLF